VTPAGKKRAPDVGTQRSQIEDPDRQKVKAKDKAKGNRKARKDKKSSKAKGGRKKP
jgi:hypothetical protein